jgi:hypothetical protein
VPGAIVAGNPTRLSDISQYSKYGYGNWTAGPGLPSDPRTDIMPAGYTGAAVTHKAQLLNFFTISDIHITDKESPAQLIYLQQLYYPNLLPAPFDALGHVPWSWQTSVFTGDAVYNSRP